MYTVDKINDGLRIKLKTGTLEEVCKAMDDDMKEHGEGCVYEMNRIEEKEE